MSTAFTAGEGGWQSRRFERDLAAEPAQVRARVRVEPGLIENAAERSGVSPFAAVLCHGVLMYHADPGPVLRTIAGLTAPTRTARSRRCCT